MQIYRSFFTYLHDLEYFNSSLDYSIYLFFHSLMQWTAFFCDKN